MTGDIPVSNVSVMTRRSFAGGVFLLSLCASASPLAATARSISGDVVLAPSGMSAFRAGRASAGSPAIIVFAAKAELHAPVRDLCVALARSGYFAIAPDIHATRLSDGQGMPIASEPERLHRIDDRYLEQALETAAHFARSEGADISDRRFLSVGQRGFALSRSARLSRISTVSYPDANHESRPRDRQAREWMSFQAWLNG